MRRLASAVLVGVLALAVASVFLFVVNDDDDPGRADAVLVLAGGKTRLAVAVELVRRGVAPTLVISDGGDTSWWAANRLCRYGTEFEVVCPRPEPYSTRGEARMLARLARERGWDSVVIVTSRFHLFRARLLAERCFDGRVAMVGSESRTLLLPWSIALEWVKLARATVRRSC